MDVPDAFCGRLTLWTTAIVFVCLVFWVNTYSFVDKESAIFSAIPDPQWFLLSCAVWGLCFIGGLMSVTYYHLHPHL